MDLGQNNTALHKRRENSLGLWRVVFTFVIMFFHFVNGTSFYSEYPRINYHWYIAVEFFFVLSGFLLAKHSERNPKEAAPVYLKKRILRLYPEYLMVFAMMAVFRSYNSGLNIAKIVIPNWLELFMLQSVGTNTFPFINNPAWYVSALIIASYLLYYLLKNYRKQLLQFIGPIGIILIYSYMFRKYERLENFYSTEGLIANTALMRAFMGLMIGVYAYEMSKLVKSAKNKTVAAVYSLLEILIFAGVLCFALFVEDGAYDFLFPILFAVGIVLASKDSILSKVSDTFIVASLDKMSYSMYLIHFFAISVTGMFIDVSVVWKWWYLLVYSLITIVLAIVLNCLVSTAMKLLGNHINKTAEK